MRFILKNSSSTQKNMICTKLPDIRPKMYIFGLVFSQHTASYVTLRVSKNKYKIDAQMHQLNKGKQRKTKLSKGNQSQGLLKGMNSLKTFESWEKVLIV